MAKQSVKMNQKSVKMKEKNVFFIGFILWF